MSRKTKPKNGASTIAVPESLMLWMIDLECRDVLIQRGSFVIRDPRWPFVVRLAFDTKTEAWVLLAGYRSEHSAHFQGNPVARGEEAIKAEVERLLRMGDGEIAAIGDKLLASVFPDFVPYLPPTEVQP